MADNDASVESRSTPLQTRPVVEGLDDGCVLAEQHDASALTTATANGR